MESTHQSPDRQDQNVNLPRRLFGGLTIAGFPGWEFTIWLQASGAFFTSAQLGGTTIDTDPFPSALESLIDAREQAQRYTELLCDLDALVDAGLIRRVSP